MAELETLHEIPTADQMPEEEKTGFGGLETTRGHLPLEAMDVEGRLDGLYATTRLAQTFVNVFDEALEATYVFPLPDRAGVTEFRLRVGERVIVGELQERGQARATYKKAIQAGHRAAIAEQERSGVFTMRAGNIPPGERVRVELELTGPLVVADGEATYRFPLVVAPRYIPGHALDGASVGSGTASDTDAVPDASRITPPVLLPGHPNPVHLTLRVLVDPAGLSTGALRSSLHQLQVEEGEGGTRIVSLRPGVERLNKDFILRLPVSSEEVVSSLSVRPDQEGSEGSFALTLVPPTLEVAEVRPRDVIVVLDRSGSMSGWKMAAARRASGRLLDTLTHHDRFAVLVFDDRVEEYQSATNSGPLVPASDRERYRAVEYLSQIQDRGGTEMSGALQRALACFDVDSAARQKVLVFVTDGQVGNEDQLLWKVRRQAQGVRIHAVGIDRAVNAGFLRRLAEPTGGVCELVESEDRLDEAMRGMYRRVASPVVTGLRLEGWDGMDETSLSPHGEVDVFPGVPVLLHGRYRGPVPEHVQVLGLRADGDEFSVKVPVLERAAAPLGVAWARGRILDLEHRYVTAGARDAGLASDITALSLRFGVLCRFTAYVAVDGTEVVNAGGEGHRVTQPVESPDGREMMEEQGGFGEALMFEDFCDDLDVASSSANYDLGGADGTMAPAPSRPSPKPRLSKFSPPADSGLGGAVSHVAGKLSGLLGSSRARTIPADPFLTRFGPQLEALREIALEELRSAKDLEALRENLGYLAADLEDLLDKIAEGGSADHPMAIALQKCLDGLKAMPEEERVPAGETFQAWLRGLAEVLRARPAATNSETSADEAAPREDFWK